MKKNIKITNYFKEYRFMYFIAFISVSIAEILSLTIPIIIKFTIDSIISNEAYGKLKWLGEILKGNLFYACFLIVGITIIQAVFQFFKGRTAAYCAEGIINKFKKDLFNHIQHLPYSYLAKINSGDLIQRSTSDMETIRKFLAVQLVEIIKVILMMIIITYSMLSLNTKLTLVGLSLIPFILIFTFFYFLRVKKYFEITDESEAEMSNVLKENLSMVRVVKAFAREDYEINKFDEKNKKYSKDLYKLIKELALYWSISDLICYTQAALIVLFGVKYAYSGEATLGVIAAFITYEAMLLWPVREFGRVLTDLGKSLVSFKRISEIMNEEVDQHDDDGIKPEIFGKIEFNNLSFSHEDDVVLKNISFKIEKGETIGILGSTGSGKSTIIKLIARLYEYNSGSIKIDDIELNQINKKWIRKNLGLVLQEPFLFAKTIKENIQLGNTNATQNDIEHVASMAAIHDNILTFEEGYNTVIGERGVSLSGGQKQRISAFSIGNSYLPP
ncbi:ABC transporter ATP-binding protein [Clostridiaceae bacterium HSG29]|nr:ABC transporter ATP-binding protein [Clostridiaceae bacterium HSG29]